MGVDECGRGCLYGPVCAAAVILPDPATLSAEDAVLYDSITDSKKLTAGRLDKLTAFIRRIAVAYGVGEASVAEIDEVNILQATMRAMHRAIAAAVAATPASARSHIELAIDGSYFRPPQPPAPADFPRRYRCIVGGDASSRAIGAASILAKTHRDRGICAEAAANPALAEYDLAKNKGYGTPNHLRALKAHGATVGHRRSFAPVAAALAASFPSSSRHSRGIGENGEVVGVRD